MSNQMCMFQGWFTLTPPRGGNSWGSRHSGIIGKRVESPEAGFILPAWNSGKVYGHWRVFVEAFSVFFHLRWPFCCAAANHVHCIFAPWSNFLATRVNGNLAVTIAPHFNTPFPPVLWKRGKSLVWLASSRSGYPWCS